MTEEPLDLATVLERIEFWCDCYEQEFACGKQDHEEIRAELAAVVAWVKQHCKE